MKRYLVFISIIISFFCSHQKLKAQNTQTVTNGDLTTLIEFSGSSCTYTWINDSPIIGLPSTGTGDITPFKAINNSNTIITATIKATPITGPGYLYVANSGDGTVSAINISDNSVISIPVGLNPIWVTVSHDGSRAYVANFNSNSISVINTATNKIEYVIENINSPSCIRTSPDDNLIYVCNMNTNMVSIINTTTYLTVGTILTYQTPAQICLSNDGNSIYTQETNYIEEFNTSTHIVNNSFSTAGNFLGIKESKDGSRIYFADHDYNIFWELNSQSLSYIIDFFFSDSPYDIYLSSDNKLVYASMVNDGQVYVVDPAQNAIISKIPVQNQPHGLFLSPDGSTLYVANYGSGDISIIDLSTNQVINKIQVGLNPIVIDGLVPYGVGCLPVTYTINVKPSPPSSITIISNPSAVNTLYGTASSSSEFNISTLNITSTVLVTPPQGFEVSSDNINFSNTITLGQLGTIASVPIYIRLAKTTNVGSYSGNIVLSTTGNNTNVVMYVSIVSPATLNVTADNKTKVFGTKNPILTLTYSGFVNNETPANLIDPPNAITSANINSPAGEYPIIITGGVSNNYNFVYTDGILTVIPLSNLIISNTFTPNGDGINDIWEIKFLNNYPKCKVNIFNRYGEMIYQSNGYYKAWDGTYNGKMLPSGVYYYIIDLQDGSKKLSGSVTIIR